MTASKKRKIPPNPQVAKRILGALDHHGMTQKELARCVGVTAPAISQIVTGSVMPMDETVVKIAEVLGEDFEFLMARVEKGTRGYGKVFGELMSRFTADETQHLLELTEDELHSMVAQHALAYAAKQRKVVRDSKPKPKK